MFLRIIKDAHISSLSGKKKKNISYRWHLASLSISKLHDIVCHNSTDTLTNCRFSFFDRTSADFLFVVSCHNRHAFFFQGFSHSEDISPGDLNSRAEIFKNKKKIPCFLCVCSNLLRMGPLWRVDYEMGSPGITFTLVYRGCGLQWRKREKSNVRELGGSKFAWCVSDSLRMFSFSVFIVRWDSGAIFFWTHSHFRVSVRKEP